MVFAADGVADVPADFLKWAIVLLFAGVHLWSQLRQRVPQPLVTSEAQEFATAAGVKRLADKQDEMEADLHALRQSIGDRLHDVVARVAEAGEVRVTRIHERIEPLSNTLHDLAGQVGQLSILVHQLIERLPAAARKG